MGDIGDVRAVNGSFRHRRQVIGPVEARAQADGVGVDGADLVDQFLLDGLPFGPRAGADSLGRHRRLVEKLVQGHRGLVLVAFRHRTPEPEGLLLRGVVHGRGELFVLEVADGVPVHDDVHPVLFRPDDALVHGCEGLVPAQAVQVRRMDGETDDVGAPAGRRGEIPFVPLPVPDQFHRIGETQTAEDDFPPLRVDELVPFHFHPAHGGGAGGGKDDREGGDGKG